jgi:hypothetical protein
VKSGEAVPIVTPAPAAGKDPEYQTVPDADLTDGDKRVIGIALVSMAPLANADSDGFLGSVSVVTSGPTPALVMGPCKVGDSLCLAATPTDKASWSTTGKYLKVGNGCFTAMDAITTAVLQTIMVNVGGSGSGSEMLYIIAVHPTYLECNTLADDSGDSYSVARPHLLRSTDTAARAVTDQAYTQECVHRWRLHRRRSEMHRHAVPRWRWKYRGSCRYRAVPDWRRDRSVPVQHRPD